MTEKRTREGLFQSLNDLLRLCEKKTAMDNKPDDTRIKWGHLLNRTVQTYGSLYDSVQLDEIQADLEKIKQKVGI